MLIGLAVPVGIFQHDDRVFGVLTRLDLGIQPRTGHPETSLRIPVHLDRLVEHRILRPERHVKARGNVEGGLRLFLVIRIPVLPVGLRGQQSLDLSHRGGVRTLESAQAGNPALPLHNQRFKLGNLDRVLPLLVFPEPKQVGPVRRAPAVEEQFVLLPNRGVQQVQICTGLHFAPVKQFLVQKARQEPIGRLGERNAIHGGTL